MRLFGEKVDGDYLISSMPFSSKEEAYQAISESWKGAEDHTTVWKDSETGLWYIVSK